MNELKNSKRDKIIKSIFLLILCMSCKLQEADLGTCYIKVDQKKSIDISSTLKQDCLDAIKIINKKLVDYLEYKKNSGCNNLSNIFSPLKVNWEVDIKIKRNSKQQETQSIAQEKLQNYISGLCH